MSSRLLGLFRSKRLYSVEKVQTLLGGFRQLIGLTRNDLVEYGADLGPSEIRQQPDDRRGGAVRGERLLDEIDCAIPGFHERHSREHPFLFAIAGHRLQERFRSCI